MPSIIQLSKNDFYLSFPDIKLSDDDINLRIKCEEIGILPKEDDTRQEFNFISSDDISTSNSISATDLKAWLNKRGTIDIFDNLSNEEYENWKELLFSNQEESIMLALSMLNTTLRPSPKFFSLWVALALFHSSNRIKTTAKSLASIYLTQEEWEALLDKKMKSYLLNSFNNATKDDLISINYIQIWSNLLSTEPIFFKEKYTKYFESKNLIECWEEFNIGELLLHSHSFCLKINSEDGLKSLHFLKEKLGNSPYIGLSATNPTYINIDDWSTLSDASQLLFNNILIDDAILNSLTPLTNVTNFTFSTLGDVTLSTHPFPKLTWLTLNAKSVRKLKILEKEETITLSLNLTSTQNIPDEVYESKTVASLYINYPKGVIIDNRIKNLKQLVQFSFEKNTECIHFSDELFKLPKLVNVFEMNHEVLKNQLSLDSIYTSPVGLILAGKPISEFPYYLANCKNLLQLSFRAHEITKIDDRVAAFKTLSQLSFPDGKMKELPDSLMKMPRLFWIDLYRQEITKISFEWIVFAYQRKAFLGLGGNPIDALPEIPLDFKIENIKQDEIENLPGERLSQKGRISISKGNIPDKSIEEYKEIFGNDFLSVTN